MVCKSPLEIPHTLGQMSSQYHFLHCHEMCTDVVEELLLFARDEINSVDAWTLERNSL